MFGKNKKTIVEKLIDNFTGSSFGDRNYQMKDKYAADQLIVANFERIPKRKTEFGLIIETTEQKYIFEPVKDGEKIKYREIFTGFIANDEDEYLNLPYVVNPVSFTDYFPETVGIEVPKLSLLWALNDINYPKEKTEGQQLKREKK